MVSRLATVTLLTHHSWLTATPAVAITLCAERAYRTTVTWRAGFMAHKAEEILPAPLTVGTICVTLAVGTVATMAGGPI